MPPPKEMPPPNREKVSDKPMTNAETEQDADRQTAFQTIFENKQKLISLPVVSSQKPKLDRSAFSNLSVDGNQSMERKPQPTSVKQPHPKLDAPDLSSDDDTMDNYASSVQTDEEDALLNDESISPK